MLTATRTATDVRAKAASRPYTRLTVLIPGLAVVISAAIQVDGAVLTTAYRTSSPVPEDQLSFPWGGATAVATSTVWAIAQLLLLVGFVAFARCGATRTRNGRTGAWMAVAGTATYVVAHVASVLARDASTDEASAIAVMSLFGIGTVLLSVGLLLAGWSTWRSGAWVSWRRTTPLALGVSMVLLLPLQFTPVLPIAVGVFALATLVFGAALLAESIDRAGSRPTRLRPRREANPASARRARTALLREPSCGKAPLQGRGRSQAQASAVTAAVTAPGFAPGCTAAPRLAETNPQVIGLRQERSATRFESPRAAFDLLSAYAEGVGFRRCHRSPWYRRCHEPFGSNPGSNAWRCSAILREHRSPQWPSGAQMFTTAAGAAS